MVLGARRVAEKNEVIAIRQEERPAMSLLLRQHMRDRPRHAAVCVDALDRPGAGAVENDHAVATPGRAEHKRRIADHLRRSAFDRYPLELPFREKTDRL